MENKYKVIIVDDHEIFRDGLKFVLSLISGLEIINEAGNGNELLNILKYQKPDIILMDIAMPEMDGIIATKKVLRKYPDIKIIALSSYGDEVYYHKMINAGAAGFVMKKSGKDELGNAIKCVLNGNNYFSPSLLRKATVSVTNSDNYYFANREIKVTKREKEVLHLICQGYSNNEIAKKLFISSKTVDKHRTNLLSKTAAKNSANLVMFVIKNNLIEI